METLLEHLKANKPKRFSAKPYYSADGDSLTFYLKDEPSYRERIDDFLTIYRSIASSKLVGCQIKGLPAALELLGDFGLMFFEDKKIKLAMIFFACMAATPNPESKKNYIELAKLTKGAEIRTKDLEPALSE